jgi:hypothetical protein
MQRREIRRQSGIEIGSGGRDERQAPCAKQNRSVQGAA